MSIKEFFLLLMNFRILKSKKISLLMIKSKLKKVKNKKSDQISLKKKLITTLKSEERKY
jgi:hypothetical protein